MRTIDPVDIPEGGWTSHRGTPLPPGVMARVDLDVLQQLYAAESGDAQWPEADSATRYAWGLGWRNPRIPEADQ